MDIRGVNDPGWVGDAVDPVSLVLQTPAVASIQPKRLPDMASPSNPALWQRRAFRGESELVSAWAEAAALKFPTLTPEQHLYLGKAMTGKVLRHLIYDDNLEKYLKMLIS